MKPSACSDQTGPGGSTGLGRRQQLSVKITDEACARFRSLARAHGLTLGDLFEQALDAWERSAVLNSGSTSTEGRGREPGSAGDGRGSSTTSPGGCSTEGQSIARQEAGDRTGRHRRKASRWW